MSDYPDKQLRTRLKRMFKCDHVRINLLGGVLWLMLGTDCNTRDDAGGWFNEHDERVDWDYIRWEVVASGKNDDELIASARHYKRLLGMTMEDYLKELV